jgi:hypothetical protein
VSGIRRLVGEGLRGSFANGETPVLPAGSSVVVIPRAVGRGQSLSASDVRGFLYLISPR